MTDLLDPLLGHLQAIEGRDDWLFLESIGPLDVLAFYTDPEHVPDESLRRWADLLRARREYFAEQGIAYQTLIAPDAHLVYRDKLPDDVVLADRSPCERLVEMLDGDTRQQFIYPVPELVAARAERETYQSVDVHWSDWGGWIAYRASIEALAKVVPAIRPLDADAVTWSLRPTFGILGGTVTPERHADEPAATIRDRRAGQTSRLVTELRGVFLVVEQDAPELPTALVFRDSFMTAPAPFFSESFRRIVFVSSSNSVYRDLVEMERPDVVIHEMGERRLVRPPTVEPNIEDFRFMFGDLILDDTEAEADQRRSRSLTREGRAAEALEANDAVLRKVPPTARLMLHRAKAHLVDSNPQAAMEALRHATTLDPDDAAPWHMLGHICDKAGRVVDSSQAFARAARAEPYQAVYWQLAMSAALRAGDLELADELRAAAMAAHPDNASVCNAASWVLAATGRLEDAEEAVAHAAEMQPDVDAHLVQLVAIQVRLERWHAAAETITRLRDLGSEHPAVQQYEQTILRHAKPPRPKNSEGTT